MELPNAQELEEVVLGALILENSSINKILDILKPEHFYNDNYKIIYRAIITLHNEKKSIDYLTIANELKRINMLQSIGGAYELVKLTNCIASASNIESHCYIIIQKSMLRELILKSNILIQKATTEQYDVFELIEDQQRNLSNILNVGSKSQETIYSASQSILNECYNAMINNKAIGVDTPYRKLNEQINGFKNGNLIILAARPGMGKTAFALKLASYPASNNTPVAFFSLEMTAQELASRVLSYNSGIPAQKITNAYINTYELQYLRDNLTTIKDTKLFIDDSSHLTIERLRIKAHKLKEVHKIKMIVIDYIQLMDSSNQYRGNKVNEVSEISRGLKLLAKELDLPIIALSQLSRQVETRTDKKPILSDLRDSGSIEQDADMVMFLMRPEYYKMETYNINGQEVNSERLLVCDIAKFRGGRTGEIYLKWVGDIMSVEDYDYNYLGLNNTSKIEVQNPF